jgi:hypothetical protein
MLSIDPGTRLCGTAWWSKGQLLGASVVHNTVEKGIGPRECATMAYAIYRWWCSNWPAPRVLALETPQIYQRAAGKSVADPNKIMPMFGVGSALAALFPASEIRFGTPHDWKGGVGKPESVKETYAIHDRVMQRLSDREKSQIAWPTNGRHCWDVDDAIGVGLYFLGRFERHRVFARS